MNFITDKSYQNYEYNIRNIEIFLSKLTNIPSILNGIGRDNNIRRFIRDNKTIGVDIFISDVKACKSKRRESEQANEQQDLSKVHV